ncbi:MAG: cupin domain-containing protein [Bacteroidetes bacterium]|nr:cupin domain-containing protein [Bacteroidota bacterium]
MPVVCKIENAPKVPFKLDGRIMFSSPKLEVVHLNLKPGERMDPHIQPFDVIFFVLQGSGILKAGNEDITVSENTCIWLEAGTERAWGNPGETEVKILVIKDLV